MSILRLSAKRDCPLAVTLDGRAFGTPYKKRSRLGVLEPLTEPWLPRVGGELDHYLTHHLERAGECLRDDQPVVCMAHGFMYDPFHSVDVPPHESDNGHRRVFHFEDYREADRLRMKAVSWPRDLGFADDAGETGLLLAFAWHSKPGFAGSLFKGGQNFYSRAYRYAEESSWVLIAALEASGRWMDARGHSQPIDIYVHSLGARLVVRGIAVLLKRASMTDEELEARHTTKAESAAARENRARLRSLVKRLGRVIVLGGSEYVVEAQIMYRRLLEYAESTPLHPGEGPQIYNVVNREDDVLDLLGEHFGPRTFGNTNVMGHNGLGLKMRQHRYSKDSRWCDMQIDSAELMEWMEKRGIRISGDEPGQIWDHWMYYTFKGNVELYRAILRTRKEWSIRDLVAGGEAKRMPQDIERQWLTGD